jgi:hypothetical protein
MKLLFIAEERSNVADASDAARAADTAVVPNGPAAAGGSDSEDAAEDGDSDGVKVH